MTDLLSPLLPYLGMPSDPIGLLRVAVTLLAWFVLAVTASIGLWFARIAASRTATEYDDVLVHRMRAPILAAILFAALADVLSPWTAVAAGRIAMTAATIGLIYAFVWLALRLTVCVALHYAEVRAAETDTGMDDMLVPIAKNVIRPIAFGVGTMFALKAAGLPIEGAALLVGGASFVLAFALQSTLEDVFGGIGLVVDTPFALGDVIRLQDGKLCQVVGLGMRVTRLYAAMDHSIITYSNRKLAQEPIVNLTRPTPDMCVAIQVAVDKASNTRLVWERLTEAANAHPWVLGEPAAKLPAMRRRMDRLSLAHDYRRAFLIIKDMGRISAEDVFSQAVDRLSTHVVAFASRAHFLGHKGFAREERQFVAADLALLEDFVRDVRRALAVWLLMVRYTYSDGRVCTLSAAAEAKLDTDVRGVLASGDGTSEVKLGRIHDSVEDAFASGFARAEVYADTVREWVEATMRGDADAPPVCLPGAVPTGEIFFLTQRQEEHLNACGFGAGLGDRGNGGISDIDEVEEYLALFAEWNKKMRLLAEKAQGIVEGWDQAGGVRLDESLHALRLWLGSEFREGTPEWKYPRTPLVGVGEKLEYELRVHVDNVRLSHFTRTAQVESQLRLDILHLLRDQSPTISIATDPDSI